MRALGFNDVAGFSFLIPMVAGILRYRKLNGPMRMLFFLSLFSAVEVEFEYILPLTGTKNNLFLPNTSFLAETVFFGVVYLLAVTNRKVQNSIFAMVMVFLAVWIIDKAFFEVPGRLNGEMGIVSRAFILTMSILVLHEVAKSTSISLVDEPIFWVTTAAILYSSGALFIYGLMNDLVKMGKSYFMAAWYINWSLAIISNLMFTKGLSCKTLPQK